MTHVYPQKRAQDGRRQPMTFFVWFTRLFNTPCYYISSRPSRSWASMREILVMPVGIEPTTSTLKGWRLNQFVDGTIQLYYMQMLWNYSRHRMVLKVGLEPTWYFYQQILRLPRLPIPPHQRETSYFLLSITALLLLLIRCYGASGGDRTHDLPLKRRLLCQLSYWCVCQQIIICKVSENYSTIIE